MNKFGIFASSLLGISIGVVGNRMYDKRLLRNTVWRTDKPTITYRRYDKWPENLNYLEEIKVINGIIVGGHKRF